MARSTPNVHIQEVKALACDISMGRAAPTKSIQYGPLDELRVLMPTGRR